MAATALPSTTSSKPSLESAAVTDLDVAKALDGVAWFGKSLVIGDRTKVEGDRDNGVRAIRRINMSASTAQSISGCAARFAIESMMPRIVNPLGPAELGGVTHEILENFYDLPAEKRTLTRLRRFVKPTVRKALKALEGTPEYNDLFAEVCKVTGDWAERIYGLENPQEVKVYKTELELKGIKLTNGVPFVGYLDRTTYEGDLDDWDNVTLLIDDYKFGKKVKRPSQMFGDHYGDQMRLYKNALYVEFGKVVESARLLWPRQGKIVPADLSDGAVRATLAAFRRSYDLMNSAADAATFPATPSALCGWCPAVNSCPVAQVKSENARTNAATMPGGSAPGAPAALPIPTIHQFAPPAMSSDEAAPRMEGVQDTTTHSQENIMTALDILTQTVRSKNEIGFPTNSSKWGIIGATGLVDAAITHLDIYNQPVNGTTAVTFVHAVGRIVEQVHREVFLGGFDWTFDSASRVVQSVKETLRNLPAPFGADLAAWHTWHAAVAKRSVVKMRLAMALAEISEFGEPAYAVLAEHTVLPEHTRNPDAAVLIAEAEAEHAMA